MLVKAQSSKALLPISFSFDPLAMVTLLRLVQLPNAYILILVTEAGMLTEESVRFEAERNM
jgi:hypothetical protein